MLAWSSRSLLGLALAPGRVLERVAWSQVAARKDREAGGVAIGPEYRVAAERGAWKREAAGLRALEILAHSLDLLALRFRQNCIEAAVGRLLKCGELLSLGRRQR